MAEPKLKMGLHHFIATGGNPKDYEGMQEGAIEEANEKELRNEK